MCDRVFYKNNANSFLLYFKYGKLRHLTDTGRNKVEFVFNICKRYHFRKKSVFSWRKGACPPKIFNLDAFRLIQRISTYSYLKVSKLWSATNISIWNHEVIYPYEIMKTMCPPSYHHNGFVATYALGHMMYDF